MPTLHVELFAGRSQEQKRELVSSLNQETCLFLGCEPAEVDIILIDVERKNWATGGRLWSETS